MLTHTNPKHIFGYKSCEKETAGYEKFYWEYFFFEAPFNSLVCEEDVFLISGRRGTGKTSLIRYITHDDTYPNTAKVIIPGHELCEKYKFEMLTNNDVRQSIEKATSEEADLILKKYAERLIEITIYKAILKAQRSNDVITMHCDDDTIDRTIRNLNENNYLAGIAAAFLTVFEKYEHKRAENDIDTIIKAINCGQLRQTVIAIDSLEQYDPHSRAEMCFLAKLIEFVADFSLSSRKSVIIKIFVGAEAYLHISRALICNPSKYTSDAIHLHWRTKSLTRLVAWRFSRFINENPDIEFKETTCKAQCKKIDFTDFKSTYECFWKPYFGETLVNKCGRTEKVYPYIMRHTQFRPRQVVMICNNIAKLAFERNCFPRFYENNIVRDAVSNMESDLANDVINAYERMYPGIGLIVQRCFSRCEIKMTGRELDEISKRGSSIWNISKDTPYEFSRDFFRDLVTRIGIIGRVRNVDHAKEIISADFQYAMTTQLVIPGDETAVVIHPMFFEYLSVHATNNNPWIIYPFSKDNPNVNDVAGIE